MLILKVIFFFNIILNKKYFKKHEIYIQLHLNG
jgi:hypothetical protein